MIHLATLDEIPPYRVPARNRRERRPEHRRAMHIGGGGISIPGDPIASAASVSPLTIFGANVLQWVRADLGITIGTGVSAWADQSGNGLHYSQGTGSMQPTLNAVDATLNSLPSLAFDGSNDSLQSSLNLPQSSVTPTCALVVAKLGAFASQGVVVGQSGNTGTNQCVISTNGSTSIFSTSGGSNILPTGYANGVWFRARADFSNSAGDIFRVGSTQAASNSGNAAGQTSRGIGAFSNGSFAQVMTAFEVLYLNIIPTAPQIAAYDAYVTAITGGAAAV